MNRKIIFILFISLFIAVSAFAEVDQRIINNEFYIESVRLNKLALETYEIGDYEASAGFANEAFLFAELSDQFVADKLIVEAKRLLDWADNNNIPSRFPNNYAEGKNYYEAAVVFQSDEEWGDAIEAAINSIEILAAFETGRPATTVASGSGTSSGTTSSSTTTTTTTTTTSNRQYTVRTWRVEKDCLWNIAGYPWVFGDSWRWKELYEANKSRMPEPNNPDLIHPGMVLDIPR